MTPEQSAARAIACAHAERETGFAWDDICDEQQAAYLATGRRAVEALAGAGLVVMTAQRAAEMLERAHENHAMSDMLSELRRSVDAVPAGGCVTLSAATLRALLDQCDAARREGIEAALAAGYRAAKLHIREIVTAAEIAPDPHPVPDMLDAIRALLEEPRT